MANLIDHVLHRKGYSHSLASEAGAGVGAGASASPVYPSAQNSFRPIATTGEPSSSAGAARTSENPFPSGDSSFSHDSYSHLEGLLPMGLVGNVGRLGT